MGKKWRNVVQMDEVGLEMGVPCWQMWCVCSARTSKEGLDKESGILTKDYCCDKNLE